MSPQAAPRPLPPAQATTLGELVQYAEGSIVSRTLLQGEAGSLTLFAFEAGQGLSSHSAPFDAYVQILDGQAELVVGEQTVRASEGQVVLMPAGVPHEVRPAGRFKMLLTMFKAHKAGGHQS